MSEEPNNATPDEPAESADGHRLLGVPMTPLRGPRDLWQIPLLLLGGALLVAGALVWIRGAEGPDFDGVLDDAEQLIERQDYDGALETLNGPILAALENVVGLDEVVARLHVLRGDALFLAQKQRGDEIPPELREVNDERILAEYQDAEELEPELIDDRRHGFLAELFLEIDDVDRAVEQVDQLVHSEDFKDRYQRLVKQIIEHELRAGPSGADRAGELLEQLRGDPSLSEDDRLWIVARQAQMQLDAGFASEAVDELLPELNRLERKDLPDAGALFLILGHAYIELGRFDMAREQLLRADGAFLPGDERQGDAEVLLARLVARAGELEEGRDRFSSVVERFPGTPAQVTALLGLGEVEADLGRFDDSLVAYRELVEKIRDESGDPSPVTPEQADLSMRQRYRARLLTGDLDTALQYANIIIDAYPPDKAPPGATRRLAETHLAVAEHLLGVSPDDQNDPEAITRMDPVRLKAAHLHFEKAGQAFEKHVAQAVVRDPTQAADSLWNAADAFDRAGDQGRAIELFTRFMQSMRGNSRQLEAKYRLARAFQAVGKYPTAITLFEEIIQDNPQSDEAYRSYIPLAQSHLRASEETGKGVQEAERWLLQVVSGRLFEPASPQFRQGLVELGRLYLREARYTEAIERLSEVLERYPELSGRIELNYDLAEANRRSATKIEAKLLDAMPSSDRSALEGMRQRRLRASLTIYEQVRADLDEIEPDDRTPLQRTLLRNAMLYRADGAFDLGDYEDAIRFYDAAAQRFADDPASLVAMVQIVNSYVALSKWREAQTAHARAQRRLRELPPDVWTRGDVPMDRRHWERWLESSVRLDRLTAQASADDPADGG